MGYNMSMYNKIFTKILDSSVWLEATPTRIVWITLIAAMDENGFCPFAAVGNVAARAHVSQAEARAALEKLEGPDPESSDPDNEGRRIERVPGGWIVLNAPKYRALVTRVNIQEKVKERVRRFRDKKRIGNAHVTVCNEDVTPSETDSRAETKTKEPKDLLLPAVIRLPATAGKEYAVTQQQVDHWGDLYPGVDVMQQLRNMVGWLESDPKRKKTTSGMSRFITNWLSKDQNRGSQKQNGGSLGRPYSAAQELAESLATDQNSFGYDGRFPGSKG